jgi:DNA-binding NarL/FixJ family response regulator
MTETIRIVLADDHPVVRKGLRLSLEEMPGLVVVGEAGDGEAALDLIVRLAPDVAVLDIDMPKRDGLAVAQRLPTRLVFLTLHRDIRVFRLALDLGVQGYLLKDSAMLEIAAAISAVQAGRPYYSSAIAARLFQSPQAGKTGADEAMLESEVLASLTPTERRVMRLIADGLSSKEIGASLAINYRTVDNHRTNICRKLGLEGTNSLLRFALQHKSSL